MLKLNKSSKASSIHSIYQNRLAGLFSIVGSVMSLGFSLNTFLREMYSLSIILLTVSIFLFISYRITAYQKYTRIQSIARHITLLGFMLLGIFLVQSGGVNNTGPLWIFVIPPVILSFCGIFVGTIYIVTFLAVISTLLFYPNDELLNAYYSYEFKSRLLYAFITSCLLSGFYEASRYRSYDELNRLKNIFETESKQDELTKLSNRRNMWEQLRLEQSNTDVNSSFIIALLDIDYFKNINDTYGHDVGDQVLKHLSVVLQSDLRKKDKLARWGGEEFLLLLPNTNEKEAVTILDNVRKRVSNTPYILDGSHISVSISIGFCQATPLKSLKEVIKFADQHLYQAKQSGRDRVIGNML